MHVNHLMNKSPTMMCLRRKKSKKTTTTTTTMMMMMMTTTTTTKKKRGDDDDDNDDDVAWLWSRHTEILHTNFDGWLLPGLQLWGVVHVYRGLN